MKSKSKLLKDIFIFIALIIITYIIVFKNYSFKETMIIIGKVDCRYIILAIIAMLLKIVAEGINVKYILGVLEEKVSLLKTIKYTFICFFFNGITPAASGGQPMEIYYMKKDGIPVTKSTATLLLELCSYHTVTIILGVIGTILNYKLLRGIVWVFILSASLKLIAAAVLFIGLYSKKLSTKLVNLFITFMEKIKYSKIDSLKEKISNSLETYHDSAAILKKEKGIFLKSTAIVFIQVMMFYSVSYFIYRSFGLNSYSYISLILISAMLLVGTSSIPLPGTVGVSENNFLKVYLLIYGITFLPSAMILYRCVNFYLFMLITFIIVLIETIRFKKTVNNSE